MKRIVHQQTTDEKAKEINFSGKYYGTFAEIGAGQEVARWFFQAEVRLEQWRKACRRMT